MMGKKVRSSTKLDARIARALFLVLAGLNIAQLGLVGTGAGRKFSAAEDALSGEDLGRAKAVLVSEAESLLAVSREFGAWDETRQYTLGLDPSYPERNFNDEWLKAAGLDIIVIINPDMEPAYVWTRDAAFPVDPEPEVCKLGQVDLSQPRTFYERVGGSLTMIAVWPVTNTAMDQESAGAVIFGMVLGERMLASMAEKTGLPARVAGSVPEDALWRQFGGPDSKDYVWDRGEERVLSLPMFGYDGSETARLEVYRERTIHGLLRSYLRQLSLALFVTVGITALVLLYRVRLIVVRPLERVISHLLACEREGRVVGTLDLGKAAGRNDEIGKAADWIDALLMTLEKRRAELEGANAELKRLASVDPLTGLANRRSFELHARKEFRRLARDRRDQSRRFCTSALLCDIDHFKPYNDRYGHQAGDACLRAVAYALAGEIFRPADVVCRYGGEEFILLLPGTDEAGARVVADRLLEAVRALGIPHEASPVASVVTISIGAATTGFEGEDADLHGLIGLADKALYMAKAEGRNRMVFMKDPAECNGDADAPDLT
ncbi:MAG: diguanylate cyclase [Spirochaetia bacterium]|nr:diguanylate cyclase [Spirochaetia bacterium]